MFSETLPTHISQLLSAYFLVPTATRYEFPSGPAVLRPPSRGLTPISDPIFNFVL